MTIISKLLHTAVTKIRDKAVSNRAEALLHARILDELFELNVHSPEFAARARASCSKTRIDAE